MFTADPQPCTRLRVGARARYVPLLRHWSYALAPSPGIPGRAGLAICGQRGVVDQDRADYLLHRPGLRVRIHELWPCRNCVTYLRLLGA